jgi:hypothetical protein
MKTKPAPITREELTEPSNPMSAKILARHSDGAKPRAAVELAVIRRLIEELKSYDGLSVYADNSEDKPIEQSVDDMIDTLFSVDESYLRTHSNSEPYAGHRFVFLVFGNDGWDVISDYSTRLAGIIDPFLDWTQSEYDRLCDSNILPLR